MKMLSASALPLGQGYTMPGWHSVGGSVYAYRLANSNTQRAVLVTANYLAQPLTETLKLDTVCVSRCLLACFLSLASCSLLSARLVALPALCCLSQLPLAACSPGAQIQPGRQRLLLAFHVLWPRHCALRRRPPRGGEGVRATAARRCRAAACRRCR